MKGPAAAASGGGKRRSRGLVTGVWALVLLSLFVPLGLLLGRFHPPSSTSNIISDRSSSASDTLRSYEKINIGGVRNQSEKAQSHHVEELIKKLAPTITKKAQSHHVEEPIKKLTPTIAKDVHGSITSGAKNHSSVVSKDTREQGLVIPPPLVPQKPSTPNVNDAGHEEVTGNCNVVSVDDNGKSCELKFGSYCLWHKEHWKRMNDSIVKKLKDRLFVARAYFPTIAKIPAEDKFTRELRQNIQDFERVLSEHSTDTNLPPQIGEKLQRMEAAIDKAKSFPVDCNNVDKKLRQIMDLTEDEANFHMKQSAFLYQTVVQTMPKSLHCLSMRLTVEHFLSSSEEMELSVAEKYIDPALHHIVVFSNNILASSVVINSTVMHAKESGNLVFHIVTDTQTYFAMKQWFFRNTYKAATVQVLHIEEIDMDTSERAAFLPLCSSEEFRVSFDGIDNQSVRNLKIKYMSIFSKSHYLLPRLFRKLKKVVVLDDDVVVQQDLSFLWSLNMGGKVNGAVQLCSVKLGHLSSYLGQKILDKSSCAWMSGLNLIDLERWRELNLTDTFQRLLEEKNMEQSAEATVVRGTFLTFQDLIYVLDIKVLSGLGHNYGFSTQALRKADVLHYNGNMKPWLELGIFKYKGFWRKFLNLEDEMLIACKVN